MRQLLFVCIMVFAGAFRPQRPVFCTTCKHYNTNNGKCTKFSRSFKNESNIDYVYHGTHSYSYFVNGIYDISDYHDAIVCRALPHLCGQNGDSWESIQS